MGQEVANSEVEAEVLPYHAPPALSKRVEHSYTREVLLSFADLDSCKKRPENLDPVVWRDAPAADGVEGGIAIPPTSSRGLVRRDSETFSKSPVDIPEWRKDSWRSGGSSALVPPGSRRKPYDEEPPGNAFSTSYPPRPAGNWGDSGHRVTFDRSALQGQGSGRWEHRAGLADRERETGRPFQKWDVEEIVAAPIVPLEVLRPEVVPRPFGSVGSVVRPGWLPAERDGLLGSGGGLHRTYTGNFTSASALRAGVERQLSMGPPERQMSLSLPERQMGMGPPPERPIGMGLPERPIGIGPPERQMSLGPPERQMSMGPPERQMSMGPLERQMSMALPERQNSFGRGVARNNEPYQPSRPLKQVPPFVRREETDLVNDETFGSETSSVDDRTEQERKRREEFELMRKGHQRVLHKQQKLLSQKHEERLANPESNASRKHDESSLWDSSLSSDVISSSPPSSPQKRSPDSEISPSAVSTPVVAPATPRPAIPPGFAKVASQKQVTRKTSFAPESPLEGDNIQAKDILKQTVLQSESGASSQEKAVGDDSIEVRKNLLPKVIESLEETEPAASSSAPMLPAEFLSTSPTEAHDDLSQLKRSIAGAGEEKQEWILPTEGGILDDKKDGISSDEAKESSFVDAKELNTSPESLLDKLFGKSKLEKGSLQDGGHPTPTLTDESQIRVSKEDAWSEGDSKTSKFAQWFHREENQLREGAVASSSDILSLFPNGGTASNASSEHLLGVPESPQTSNSVNVPRSHVRVLPMPSGPSLEDIEKGLKENASSGGQEQGVTKVPSFMGTLSLKILDVEPRGDNLSGAFGEHSPVGKFNFRSAPPSMRPSRSSPVFLTCEDIEQSMLAEAGTTEKSIPNLAEPSQPRSTPNPKDGQAADSAASRHLLSLLQKGAAATGGKHSPENSWSSHTQPVGGAPGKADAGDLFHDGDDPSGAAASKNLSSGDATLEALFGKAFMSDLRSTKAPLSANANLSDYFDNAPEGYPVSRQQQSSGRVNNLPAKNDVLQHWPGQVGWIDSDGLEMSRHRSLKDVTNGNQFVSPEKEESQTVTSSSSRGFWGNGGGISSDISDGSLPINTTGVGNKGSFVSSSDSTSSSSFMVTDNNSVKGKGHLSSRVHNSDVDMRRSSKVTTGDGKIILPSSGNFAPGQLSRVSEDSPLLSSQGKVLSSDGPVVGPLAAFDSSGLPQAFKEADGLGKRVGDIRTTAKFGAGERDENTAAVNQGIDGFLLRSRSIDRKEISEQDADDKIALGDNSLSGIDRKVAADSLSDTAGFLGKAKDGNARAFSMAAAAGGGGLTRSNSSSVRFKNNNNVGALLQQQQHPTSPFNGFPVGGPSPLQHQQSLGAMYRSDSLTSLSRQSSLSVQQQHHLQQQQNPGAGLAMFPPQQFHPQPGLAQQQQQQQLLARTFSNGSQLEFPHVPYGHAPSPNPRQLPAGHMHFPTAPHGHLSPPGAYPPMGPMGPPTPNHFLPPAQMPQRGPSMSPMGSDGHMFIPDQSMHDPHGLGSKQGSQQQQQGPSLFPLGGHALQSGQGPMFHQPLPPMRGQQNQLLPGPTPWDLRSYSSEQLMRTSSKSHEISGFVNGNGGGVNSVDRWFGMELSRNVSGISAPGLLQVSPHALDAESKVRFG